MSEDEALKTGLAALAELTKELRDQKLKGSGMPTWVPWVTVLILQLIALVWFFSQQDAQIKANRDKIEIINTANAATHTRLSGYIKTNSRNVRTLWAKVFPGTEEPPDGDGH